MKWVELISKNLEMNYGQKKKKKKKKKKILEEL